MVLPRNPPVDRAIGRYWAVALLLLIIIFHNALTKEVLVDNPDGHVEKLTNSISSGSEKHSISESERSYISGKEKTSLRILHIGNSIQFYNDGPNMLRHMLEKRYSSVTSDACLVGGATLLSLMEIHKDKCKPEFIAPVQQDRGQVEVKTTENLLKQQWDFVVFNDQSQTPARIPWRKESSQVLKDKYLPLIQESASKPTIVFVMTAAYSLTEKGVINYSGDLGSFDDFTNLLKQGYEEYASILPNSKIAPLGIAYQQIKNAHGKKLWKRMYASDNYHPSPHGSYLEACLIYCTITREKPPVYDKTWWEDSRYMEPPMPLPSDEDAKVLREVACNVCGVSCD